jgi:hypothetical protein
MMSGLVFLLGAFLTVTAWLVETAEGRSAPPVASFSSWEHGFEGPDVLPAGLTTLQLQNRGQAPHQLQLLQLTEGRTPAELVSYLQGSDGDVPSWAKHRGGPNGVSPGDSAEATIYLEPGTYVITCAIPNKARPAHTVRDLSKTLYVVAGRPTQPEFMGDVHMAMFEYEFVVVQHVRSGPQTFYVVNRGTRIHQVSLVRLNPDASAADMLGAFAPTSTAPLPGTLLGGMTGLEPGGRGMFTAALSRGRYALICLFPNPTAHDSHAAKGMVMNFTVE